MQIHVPVIPIITSHVTQTRSGTPTGRTSRPSAGCSVSGSTSTGSIQSVSYQQRGEAPRSRHGLLKKLWISVNRNLRNVRKVCQTTNLLIRTYINLQRMRKTLTRTRQRCYGTPWSTRCWIWLFTGWYGTKVRTCDFCQVMVMKVLKMYTIHITENLLFVFTVWSSPDTLFLLTVYVWQTRMKQT